MKVFIRVVLLFLVGSGAQAQTYIDISSASYRDAYEAKSIFVEESLTDSDSVSVSLYKDPIYESVYVGYAKRINDLYLTFAVGEANIDGAKSFGVNPSLWYKDDVWEAYAEYEYLKDDADAWYYRTYLHADVIQDFVFAGVYSERGVGTGPLVGLKFEKSDIGIKLFGVKLRKEEYGIGHMVSVALWLEF